MDKIIVDAPAKINLFLQVGPAGPDGFHPVRTVMQSIDLCDRLEMELVRGEGFFQLEPRELDGKLGGADDNLAWRAWELFAREARLDGQGLRLKLSKHIPVAAGLGGGSADAAAVLLGANRLLDEPLSPQRLSVLAARLGSDVPYFLTGGTALAEGRGERITPLAPAPDMHVVLANPGVPLSTASVYRHWDALAGGSFAREDLEVFLRALRREAPAELLSCLRNDLQESCLALMPQAARLLAEVRAGSGRLVKTGSSAVMVSGSGPTVFALLEEEDAASELSEVLREYAPTVVRTRFRSRGCGIDVSG
jgi:4-diphosphocytidyl-2-C-methyl-D-erythritol kinase